MLRAGSPPANANGRTASPARTDECQVNDAPHRSGHAGGMTDLTLALPRRSSSLYLGVGGALVAARSASIFALNTVHVVALGRVSSPDGGAV